MKIDYPSEAERKASIEYILNQTYPKEEKLKDYLVGIYHHIGLNFLLHGMGRMMLFVLILYFSCIFCTKMTTEQLTGELWVYVVVCAPLSFILPLFLSIIGEKEQEMLELQMTCRYTAYHVLTLRMILAILFAMVSNSAVLGIIFYKESIDDIVHIVFLSISAVLAYAVLFLIVLWKRKPLLGQIGLCVCWIFGHFALWFMTPQLYGFLAIHVPLLCHVVVWVLMGTMAAHRLQKGLRYGFMPLS